MTNKHIGIRIETRTFLKTHIWSTMLYGCGAWKINKQLKEKIEAAEVWFWQRMLRISWMDRLSNEMLERMGMDRDNESNKEETSKISIIIREEGLENLSLTGKIADV